MSNRWATWLPTVRSTLAAVVLALLVVGAVLLTMLLRGASLDGDTRLDGPPGPPPSSATAAPV